MVSFVMAGINCYKQ